MRRRSLVLLAAVAAVAALGYTAYWFAMARQLRDGLPAWAEARRAEGLAFGWRSVELAGFPFALRLRFTAVTLEAARPLPYRVTADALTAEAAPWRLGAWRFAAPQGAAASLPRAAAGMAFGTLAGSVARGSDGTRVTFTAGALRGQDAASGFAAAALDGEISLPARAPEHDRDPDLVLGARLAQAELPWGPGFARRLDALSLAATLRGPMPPRAALDQTLAAWRDQGGTLDIDAAHVAAIGVTIDVAGTLALDEDLQPEGALTAAIVGADTLIDAAAASGTLDPRYAGGAKAVLRAIAIPGDGGGTVRVPVSVQDRRLYVGPAPLVALPRITWRPAP